MQRNCEQSHKTSNLPIRKPSGGKRPQKVQNSAVLAKRKCNRSVSESHLKRKRINKSKSKVYSGCANAKQKGLNENSLFNVVVSPVKSKAIRSKKRGVTFAPIEVEEEEESLTAFQKIGQNYFEKYFSKATDELPNLKQIDRSHLSESFHQNASESAQCQPDVQIDSRVFNMDDNSVKGERDEDQCSQIPKSSNKGRRRQQSESVSNAKQRALSQKKRTKKANIKRCETMPEKELKDDKDVKQYIRKGMDSLIKSDKLPKQNYVAEELKKFISSPKFKKILENRKLLEESKLLNNDDDFSEVMFNVKEHDKELIGLLSRQYAPTFFRNFGEQKTKDIFNELNDGLLRDYKEEFRTKVRQLLANGQNHLLILYDVRKPKVIAKSKNRESVIDLQRDPKPRQIGFVIFQESYSLYDPVICVHLLFGKQRRKNYKKKVLLALKTAQERLRATEILISVNKSDLNLYVSLGYKPANKTDEDLDEIGIYFNDFGKLMKFDTNQYRRDVKRKIQKKESKDLRKKAKKLEKDIERLRQYMIQHQDELKASIQKNAKSKAQKSDQAKTPKWLFKNIKKYAHLTDDQLKDIFVYQEKWNAKYFFDGYKREWDTDLFHYVNSPFSQVIAALNKCADFQIKGGNCAMILPSVSLLNNDLYNKRLRHTTVRKDLKLFAFDGFEFPLMKHIVLLYFLQPSFVNELIEKKQPRIIDTEDIILSDLTRLRITHYPQPLAPGRRKRQLTDEDKEEILFMYLTGVSIRRIRDRFQIRYQTVRAYLYSQLGVKTVEAEQLARSKGLKTDFLYNHLQEEVF